MNTNHGMINDLATGKIIIAEPFMRDEYFKRSVILLTDYHKEGTIGFLLNKPLRMNIKTVISDFPKSSAQVFLGGPVQNEMIHYIHTAGEFLDGSKEIFPGVYWGGDFQQLKFLISNKVIGPHDIRFYMGYSGWGPGQLEAEIDETNSWLISSPDPNYVFYNENVDLWKQAMSHKGKNYSLLASIKEELSLN